MIAWTREDPSTDRLDLTVRFGRDEYADHIERYARVVLDRAVTQIVDAIVSSAAVQARIAHLRAELPVRVEAALVQALADAVLATRPTGPPRSSK